MTSKVTCARVLHMAVRDGAAMKAIFLDCNDQLAPVWDKGVRADDPPIDVKPRNCARNCRACSMATTIASTTIPTCRPSWSRCKALKHIVFLGTGAASYMNVEELKSAASPCTPSRAMATPRWPSIRSH